MRPGAPVALGYSGGGDSHALLHLAAPVGRDRGAVLHALIIDHGLRGESAAEAESASSAARRAGAEARIISWTGDKPATGLQAAARQARHGLLAQACADIGARDLLLAHTLEDQAETIAMRLASGGGRRALGGMGRSDPSPLWPDGRGLRLHRPLLDQRRAALRAWLAAQGEDWIEDPSNADPRWTRIRWRRRLAELEKAGLSLDRFQSLSDALRAVDTAEAAAAARLVMRAVRFSKWGGARLKVSQFASARPAIAARALEAVTMAVSGAPSAPAAAALAGLRDALHDKRGATGAGVRLVPAGEEALLIRDPGAVCGRVDHPDPVSLTLSPGACGVYDGRFELRAGPAPLRIGPLGAHYAGLTKRSVLDGVPGSARPVLTALRDADGAVLAIAGLYSADGLYCRSLAAERAETWLFPQGAPAWFDGVSTCEQAGPIAAGLHG